MQIIRDDFIKRIQTTAASAIGVSVVLQLGIIKHLNFTLQNPDAQLLVGIGEPDNQDARVVQFAPTHQEIQSKLRGNRDIIYGLYLTELVQYWFDFLSSIYRKVVNEKLNGRAHYRIPIVQLKIDFDKASNNATEHIEEVACKNFYFLESSEKLKVVKKILDVNLEPVENDIKNIKANILVRNIFQHKFGIVSSDDLSRLGASNIEVDEGNNIKNVQAGEKITRTAFDIEKFVLSLINVAKTLIP